MTFNRSGERPAHGVSSSPAAEAERVADGVGVDPELLLGVEVAGTQGDRPLVGGVQVVDREVEVHLLLHVGVGPRRGVPWSRVGRAHMIRR